MFFVLLYKVVVGARASTGLDSTRNPRAREIRATSLESDAAYAPDR